MEFACVLVHHQSPPGVVTIDDGLEAITAIQRVDTGSQTLREARVDYEGVCRFWMASKARSRRCWARWSQEKPELLGIDPFAQWDLTAIEHRYAFAALSELAVLSDEAMSAWCSKAAALWNHHFARSNGRRRVAEGASLTALAIGLRSFSPADLRERRYPFGDVMERARRVERWREPAPVAPVLDPRLVRSPVTDEMDAFAGLADTVSLLREMVHTHRPCYQPAMAKAIDEQVSAYLGEAEWSPTASLRNRQKLKRRRQQLRQAA